MTVTHQGVKYFLKLGVAFIQTSIRYIMNKPVKFESKMNNTALTISEGEYKSSPGAIIACKYYGGMKQQWHMNVEN